MRYAIRLVAGLLAVFSASTALAQSPTPPPRADYFPLNKGSKWVYKVGGDEVVVTVVGLERFGNEDYARLETQVGKDSRTSELYARRADGVYRTQVKEDAVVPPVKVLPLPVKVGDKWAVDSKVGTQTIKGTLAIKSDRERVKVPAGEFDTVFVEGIDMNVSGAKTTVRLWFARGYGIVKEEFVLPTNEKVVLELFKYEPGAAPPPAPEPVPEVAPAPPWAFAEPCRILPRCTFLPVTTQESCGCCARSVRCWVRRR